MANVTLQYEVDEASLLTKFNKREIDAFEEVYRNHFNRLYYFANKHYIHTEIMAEDVIQDIFASIWEKEKLKFNSLDHLIGYIYLSIRNKYKDYAIKQVRVDKFKNYIVKNEENISSQIIESETLSIISSAIDMLPEECAKVFKMHIEGWEIKDIAKELNKSPSTIYNQRKEAIEILKKKISKNAFVLLMSII